MSEVEYRPIEEFPFYRIGIDASVWTLILAGTRRSIGTEWRRLKAYNNNGYRSVILRRDGKEYHKQIHRLLMGAFVGPCPPGMMVCHNNGNPSDNRLCNLRYGTMASNQADRILHGTSNRGEQHGCSKLKIKDVMAIRGRIAKGERQIDLAHEYGLDPSTVSYIVRRKLWRHVS